MRERKLRWPTRFGVVIIVGLVVGVALGTMEGQHALAQVPALETSPLSAPNDDTPVAGTGTCPAAVGVWHEMQSLIPADRLTQRMRDLRAGTPVVEVADMGLLFRVVAAGRSRVYRDEARDCGHRARVSAVFAALALDPASFADASPAPLSSVSPLEPQRAPSHEPGHEAGIEIALGGVADVGITTPNLNKHFGVDLHIAMGRGPVVGIAGVRATGPSEMTVAGLPIREWRIPVDLGVRFRRHRGSLSAFGDLALSAAMVSEEALELVSGQKRQTLEWGGLGAVGLSMTTRSSLSPFIATHVEVVPRPATFFALPWGTLGHTPYLWIGVSAGASIGF